MIDFTNTIKNIIDDFVELRKEIIKVSTRNPNFFTNPKIARQLGNNFFIDHSGEKEEIKDIKDFTIINSQSDYPIPVRLYNPESSASDKIIMFTHGGGFVQGNIETHDYLCRKIANALNIKVISSDYRLAPEHQFPTALDDIAAVYKWCINEYKDIILCGDSAGGNLSAALCIKIAEEKIKKPLKQILLYPLLSNDLGTESYQSFGELLSLTKESVFFFCAQYVGSSNMQEDIFNNKLFFPILEEDFSIFPDTIIVSAAYDVLLDEATLFIEKLKKENVPAIQIKVEDTIHSFMTYGKEFNDEVNYTLEQIKRYI